MFSMTLVLTLASAFLLVPANVPQANADDHGVQVIALADDTPQDTPAVGRGRGQGRQPVAAQRGRRGRGSQEGTQLTICHLKHADCQEFAEIARSMYPGMPIQSDWRTNSVILNAHSEQLKELQKLIESLDTPEAVESKRPDPATLVFIHHRDTRALALQLNMLLGSSGLRAAADEGRSAILLSGPAVLIAQAQNILDELDTPAFMARLEFAFFKATMDEDDATVDEVIPEDLKEVANELRRFGRIELLGRLHTVATESEKFEISGLAIYGGAFTRIGGRVISAAGKGSVKLSVNAELTMMRSVPDRASQGDDDDEKRSRRRPSPEFSVETIVSTERGHYVVLGSAPSGWRKGESAILVLQVLP